MKPLGDAPAVESLRRPHSRSILLEDLSQKLEQLKQPGSHPWPESWLAAGNLVCLEELSKVFKGFVEGRFQRLACKELDAEQVGPEAFF